jgi:hypothetical protein
MISSRILRDYTSNIDRFMLKTSTKCYRTTDYENKLMGYENAGAYLAGLLEGDGHIDIQREDTETKKVNPSLILFRIKPARRVKPCGVVPKGLTRRGQAPCGLDLYSLFIRPRGRGDRSLKGTGLPPPGGIISIYLNNYIIILVLDSLKQELGIV